MQIREASHLDGYPIYCDKTFSDKLAPLLICLWVGGPHCRHSTRQFLFHFFSFFSICKTECTQCLIFWHAEEPWIEPSSSQLVVKSTLPPDAQPPRISQCEFSMHSCIVSNKLLVFLCKTQSVTLGPIRLLIPVNKVKAHCLILLRCFKLLFLYLTCESKIRVSTRPSRDPQKFTALSQTAHQNSQS